ncbi:neuron derived neurotrophic factor nord [Lycorma delicatula]|uniref:neuron derived neurotrophic factor nord n=1 Tax=Lycorma delicatula TaxID=130591 RepID=UPI003F5197C6
MMQLVWLPMILGVVMGTNEDLVSELPTEFHADPSLLWRKVSELSSLPRVRTKGSRYRFSIHKEKTFNDTNVIPEDHQVSTFLQQGKPRLFFFLLQGTTNMLSFIVTPCGSEVFWTLVYRHQNDTGKLDQSAITNKYTEPPLKEYSGREPQTFAVSQPRQGLYQLQVRALHRDTHLSLYASLQPLSSIIPRQPKIRLQKRQRKRKLTVRWEQSELDPFNMHYCVVINTVRDYKSLCEARNGMKSDSIHSFHEKLENFSHEPLQQHVVTSCVRKKTSYTIDKLETGKKYYFNVFVINKKTNLSLPYGSNTLLFDNRTHALGLKDNKPVSVSLRHFDGKAIFRYKVTSKAKLGIPLEWQVLPCGGAVDAEIKLQRQTIIPRQQLSRYTRFKVDTPKLGQRYALHVLSSDTEESHHVSGVEVVASMQGAVLPLGLLPEEAQVIEYVGLRQCNSVTIGWQPVPQQEGAHYCIRVTETPPHSAATHFVPSQSNQCGLDARLKTSTDFYITQCLDRSPNEYNTVLTQKISNLKPGKQYNIQLTVKKPKGKTLSYDLLHVYTKSKCS